mgnify:FL=1
MARYTQRLIMSTFEQMLAEMPFDKITVSALVKRCDISPNTFYYHYRDLSDLLNAWLSTAMEPFFSGGAEHWQENLIALLNALKQRPEIVYHVSVSLSREQMERYVFLSANDFFDRLIDAELKGRALPAESKKDMADFCRYAFLGFFLRFIWNRMEDDAADTVRRLGGLCGQLVAGSEELNENGKH